MIELDAEANTELTPTPGEIADSPKNRSRAKKHALKLNERLRLPDDVVAEIEAAFLKLINTTSLIERSWFRESGETAKAIEGLYTEAESKRHPVSELVKLAIPRIRSKALEEAAELANTGDFCRYVDHVNDLCRCDELAAAIRELAEPSVTGNTPA